MKLSKSKAEYFIRFKHRLLERSYLIDVLANVGNRPMVITGPTAIADDDKTYRLAVGYQQPSQNAKIVDLAPFSANYDMPAKEVPDEYKNDEAVKWRAESGIEIIFPQESPYDLVRVFNNWLLMPDEQKTRSDSMCKKLFYYDNQQHFRKLMEEFVEDDHLKIGNIVNIAIPATKQLHRVFIDEVVSDSSKSPTAIHFKYLDNGDDRPFSEIDTFTIDSKAIDNYTGAPVETTVGRFLLNYMLLAKPFGKYVDYWNAKWDISGIEKKIATGVMSDDLTVAQLKEYQDNLFFIGHFAELCVPTFSKKALGTSPDVAVVKKQLLEKYKDRLSDPLVIAEIENTLLALDKKHLEGDSAMRFYGILGGKAINIARKKMFLTVGGIEAFSKESGKYNFLPNALTEGWDKDYVPVIANEIRKGSYNRGYETQLGGVQTKLITRVFQDLKVDELDCNTSRGLVVDFSRWPITDFKGRWLLDRASWVLIEDSNLSKYQNGTYIVRSPMYCESKTGLCYKCCGENFRKLNTKQVAVLEIDISTTFLLLSMKNMHGTKLELFEINDLNPFIFE